MRVWTGWEGRAVEMTGVAVEMKVEVGLWVVELLVIEWWAAGRWEVE